MRSGVTSDEILGCFESVDENNDKIQGLNLQIKALRDDSGEIFKSSAADFEIKPKVLKDAYKKYLEMKDGEDTEDFYTILSMVGSAINANDGE